jgi:DNA-binding transcriptional LysR family regulator
LALFERGRSGVRLTAGGRSVMLHARRALAELDAVHQSGARNGSGEAGEVRLGVRLPPIGEPLSDLLAKWRVTYPNVVLTVSEMNDRDLATALEERRLDAALTFGDAVPPQAECVKLYAERVVAAIPAGHRLAEQPGLDCGDLCTETILVQGWEESQAARQLYTSLLGDGARFRSHPASKQSVLALVGAGFGVTLATAGQAEVAFPGVVFRELSDADLWIEIVLAWLPTLEDATVGRFVAFFRDQASLYRLT